MLNIFKNKDQSPSQSNIVLRVIGDRDAGKTAYMASLARWPNASPDSPVQTVVPVDEGGEDLVNKAQNILEQGLELELATGEPRPSQRLYPTNHHKTEKIRFPTTEPKH